MSSQSDVMEVMEHYWCCVSNEKVRKYELCGDFEPFHKKNPKIRGIFWQVFEKLNLPL